jgi:hypothetical protein
MGNVRLWVSHLSTICVEAFETREKPQGTRGEKHLHWQTDRGKTRHGGGTGIKLLELWEAKYNPFRESQLIMRKGDRYIKNRIKIPLIG